jgi:hypothetical protein
MRFKIDVSDRETGEVATLEVDAPTAQAARQHLRQAGYMIWATEPAPSVPQRAGRRRAGNQEALDRLAQEAWHGTFRAHPVRFVLAPTFRLAAGALLWSSAAVYFLHVDLPRLPYGLVLTATTLIEAAVLFWIAGVCIGRPVSRGCAAQRVWADSQIVCRYCRRRGNVQTSDHLFSRRRCRAHCNNCGIHWLL